MVDSPGQKAAIELFEKLQILNERLWDRRASRPVIEAWLDNFAGGFDDDASERLNALYLLSEFMFFAQREVRELLRSLYRDLFRYRQIERIRRENADTTDLAVLEPAFQERLSMTRFLGVGNPAESGNHLLYFFRQENDLDTQLFVTTPELFDRPYSDPDAKINQGIARVVLIDDLCGSGSQAQRYSKKYMEALRGGARRAEMSLEIFYLCLFATTSGLADLREKAGFDAVESVFELDDSHKSLTDGSRYFENTPFGVSRAAARSTAEKHGLRLLPEDPLGFGDGQLLLGFSHNIPNNTLPIIWFDNDHELWTPIFRRYEKSYA